MKSCTLCNKGLSVYWSEEGQELCDECFNKFCGFDIQEDNESNEEN